MPIKILQNQNSLLRSFSHNIKLEIKHHRTPISNNRYTRLNSRLIKCSSSEIIIMHFIYLRLLCTILKKRRCYTQTLIKTFIMTKWVICVTSSNTYYSVKVSIHLSFQLFTIFFEYKGPWLIQNKLAFIYSLSININNAFPKNRSYINTWSR